MEIDSSSRGARLAWLPLIALLALLLGNLFVRVALITGHGTYPIESDEWFLAKKALRVVQTGDANPGWFKYGSLPIYLAASGIAAGSQIESALGNLDAVADIRSVGYPFYSHPWTMLIPRLGFALISILGLLAAGALGWGLERRPAAALMPIAALTCSTFYLRQSWSYLNVDIVASALCLIALAYLVHTLHRQDLIARVLVPAAFCGAVVATKYNSGLIGLPFLIVLIRARRYGSAVLLLVASLAAFFIFQPFALLDHTRFISDALEEMKHYRVGRSKYSEEPGLAQLVRYLADLGRDFGWPLFACAILGIKRAFSRDRATTWLALAFPLAVLLHMSTQRLHITRTVLPAFAVLSVFMGLGVVTCWDFALRWVRAGGEPRTRMIAASVVGCVAASLTFGPGALRLARAVSDRFDSRVHVGQWLHANAQAPCTVIVPEQLVIDPRDLSRCTLVRADLKSTAHAKAATPTHADAATHEHYALFAKFDTTHEQAKSRTRAWDELLRAANPVLYTGHRDAKLTSTRSNQSVSNPRLTLYRFAPLE
jgi:hypothetical protein